MASARSIIFALLRTNGVSFLSLIIKYNYSALPKITGIICIIIVCQYQFSIILKGVQLIRERLLDWLWVRYIRTRLDAVITVPSLFNYLYICMYPITFIVCNGTCLATYKLGDGKFYPEVINSVVRGRPCFAATNHLDLSS